MGFSVLMSIYKKEKADYLKQALDSLLEQTLQADEIVLVEDGPLTEELYEVIEDFRKKCPYLVICRLPCNVQLGRALAKGLELCSNDLVARMDTDDISVNTRFWQQYSYMKEHPNVSVLGGWMEEFNDGGTYSNIKRMPELGSELKKYGKYRNPVNHMTVMFRKKDVLRAGGYRHMPLLEDYDLWSRMLAGNMEFHNLKTVLVKMRTNEDLYERRGGISYCRQYLKFRRVQYGIGWLNKKEYFIAVILTMGMTMQPARLRRAVYQKMLRR